MRKVKYCTLDTCVREKMELGEEFVEFIGRRPAFCQWSDNPIQGRRLAIGDAALAYDPIAGQGIRFAIASAFAAAATINTWRTSPQDSQIATRFYEQFVDDARRRHLAFLGQFRGVAPPPVARGEPMPDKVVFSAHMTTSQLHLNARIIAGEVLELNDGVCIRTLGGVDLLHVRDLARSPVRSADLVQELVLRGCKPAQARSLLRWCFEREIITAAGPGDG